MDKNTFISIVLGLDALTIGTFGTAAYENGRPIVGIVFLFTLVVISGIAFGFAMSNQKEVRSAKLNETVDTEAGVYIMKNLKRELEEDMSKRLPCPQGLCIMLKDKLAEYKKISRDCITITMMHQTFPYFNYENAKNYGNAKKIQLVYWWNRDDILPRIKFLEKMIEWQEKQ